MRVTMQKGFSGIDERVALSDGFSAASVMSNLRLTDSGALEKRSGIQAVCSFADDISGIWSGHLGSEETVIIASGGFLYSLKPNIVPTVATLLGKIGYGECMIFEFNGAVYVKTEDYYGKYNGTILTEVAGYVPCVAMGCDADGSGEIFEQINLLSDKRRQLFSADGISILYRLAETDIDSVESLKVNGVEYTGNYSLEGDKGWLSFEIPPDSGINNMEVIYVKATSLEDRSRIMKTTKIMLFGGNSDGRAFLWGNPDFPNYRFHSDLANGIPSVEYFPVNGYTVIGNSKINCIVQQYDRQLIFTKNEAYYSYSELRDDGLGNTVSSFPVYSLNGSKGCMFETDGCIIDNRPVTLCDDGLNIWESTSVENEKNAVCISAPIENSMAEILASRIENLHMLDFQANRELYFICGDKAFVYNYSNGGWYSYDGFIGTHYSVCGNVMYIGNGNVIYAFGYGIGENNSESCYWQSAFSNCGQNSGRCDITAFEADVYIKGPAEFCFGFEKSNGEVKRYEYSFGEDTDKFMRISLRPSLKRAMPIKLTFSQAGTGKCTLHRLTVKTREKERSDRHGIH